MRIRNTFVAVIMFGIMASIPFGSACSAQSTQGSAGALSQSASSNAIQPEKTESVDEELAARLREISERAGGDAGVAVIHVETGRSIEIQGAKQLPLFSVFKLPVAVAVLKAVEENKLRLDQKVRVTPAEILPGWRGNTDLWRDMRERTVRELLEMSIIQSDNTSSDKLLELVGGPSVVTERMRALGLQNIDIHFTIREFLAHRDNPNKGAASDLAHLLARLQKDEVLQPPQRTLLIGMMERATTGKKRLRGDLPRGTQVADKTGTGDAGEATNDVGLITLPHGKGHLAMAVLLSRSKLPPEAQEKLIAELARAAYDAHVAR